MSVSDSNSMQHIGESKGMANHDHDLVHELSKQLDSIWRYDQYAANAEGKKELATFWSDLKDQSQNTVDKLRRLIKKEIDEDCF